MTSRLCSMTTTEWPAATSCRNAPSRVAMSSKCRPVVGSSKRKRFPRGPRPLPRVLQVAGQLQPLRLPAAERRHRLPEAHVPQAYGRQRRQGGDHLGGLGEELAGLRHRHGKHVGHRFRGDARRDARAPRRQQPHLQHLGSETLSVAVGTAQVHVAQELHLDVLEPAAAAGRTAAGSRVEAEGARRVPALAGERLGGEELSHRVECPHVAHGVRAGGPARWGSGRPAPPRPPARAPRWRDAFPAGPPACASASAGRCTARPASAWTFRTR